MWTSRRELLLDLLPIAVLLTLTVVYGIPKGLPADGPTWLERGTDLALIAALLVRRRYPMTLLAVVAGVCVTTTLLNLTVPGQVFPAYDPVNPWLPLAATVACYTAAAHVPHRPLTWVLVVGLSVVAARPWASSTNVLWGAVLMTDVAALIGLYFGVRRRLEQALRDRAERAEREQHLMAERARSEERTRLAGEMHDVVTHRVSLMVLQAGALGVTARDEATRAAAEDLRAAGCQALDELRDLVGVLQGKPGEAEDDGAVGAGGSVATLDLSNLVAESEAVGAAVELVEEGNAARLSPVVTRTAYRIVQEALTNVRKHSPNADVQVHIRYGGDRVRLGVHNARPKGPPDEDLAGRGSGTGLTGLRQRVELVGGSIEYGPRPDGGFGVDAILPAYVPTREARG